MFHVRLVKLRVGKVLAWHVCLVSFSAETYLVEIEVLNILNANNLFI